MGFCHALLLYGISCVFQCFVMSALILESFGSLAEHLISNYNLNPLSSLITNVYLLLASFLVPHCLIIAFPLNTKIMAQLFQADMVVLPLLRYEIPT
jgi:hypothetical protein